MSATRRSAAELLRAGLPVEVETRGGSMWPFVRAGDRVRIEPGKPVRVGDLVAYQRGGGLVVHRVTRVEATTIRTRGDAARVEEPPLPLSDVLGVVTHHRLHDGPSLDHASHVVHAVDRVLVALHPLAYRPARVLRRIVTWARGSGATAEPGDDRFDGVGGEQDVEGPAQR